MPNPYFGIIPRSSSLGDPTIPLAQLLKPYPDVHDGEPVSQQRRHDALSGARARGSAALRRTGCRTRSPTRDRSSIDDASSVFDASILTGPVANYPVADSFNRALERDYSTGDIPHVFVASVVWDLPAGAGARSQPRGVLGALVNDWTRRRSSRCSPACPIAVTQATNFNAFAGFGMQRPNLVGDPDAAGGSANASALVQHRRIRRRAAVHDRHRPRAIPCAGPRTATSTSR